MNVELDDWADVPKVAALNGPAMLIAYGASRRSRGGALYQPFRGNQDECITVVMRA